MPGNRFDQIVIGFGTSALTFMHAAFHGTQKNRFLHKETLVIGKNAGQLWDKVGRYDPAHRMGQPEHLLRPSGTNPHLGVGPNTVSGGHSDFMRTDRYNEMLGSLREKVAKERESIEDGRFVLVEDDVANITRDGPSYRVTTAKSGVCFAKQVIVAGGTGGEQKLQKLRIPFENSEPFSETGEYISAIDYMTHAQPRNKRVLIYGGSATSSWCVAHAFAMDASQVLWGCRRGLPAIKVEGNPVGRNSEIIRRAEKAGFIYACSITNITGAEGGRAFEGRLTVTFAGDAKPAIPEPIVFDQVVYAIGADATSSGGPGAIIDKSLHDRMVPVWDHNYRFALTDDQKVITALTDGNNLFVVGAAVFRGLGLKTVLDKLGAGEKNAYARAGDILCSACRPPEGIAIVDTTINALTGFRQNDLATFNWNKANRRDIFQVLAKTYQVQIPLSIRERIVNDIVAERAKTDFGVGAVKLMFFMESLKKKYRLNIDVGKLA